MSEDYIGIELLGGPSDGRLLTVAANTKIWISPDQAFSQHIYAWTTKISPHSGGRIFQYTGHQP